MGGLLLAAIYHTCLLFFRRNKYLSYYVVYLWICACSLLFESIFVDVLKSESHFKFLFSNLLRISCFQMYIVFVIEGVFNSVKKKFPYLWKLYIATFFVNGVYLFVIFGSALLWPNNANLRFTCFLFSNIFLIATAIIMLGTLLREYQDKFTYSIIIGSSAMVLLNIVAVVLRYSYGEQPAVAMGALGFFIEIIFFSVAIGLKLKQDEVELLKSNAQLAKQEQMLKQSEFERQIEIYIVKAEERKRISRDMHDGITNDLLGLKFYVKTLKNKMDNQDCSMLDPLEKELTTIYNDSRKFMHLLFAQEDGKDYMLDVYIQTLAKKLKDSGLKIWMEMPEEINIELNIFQKNNIYLIVKEALSNILKHARATSAKVMMKIEEEECIVRIADNGVGLTEKLQFGIGLKSMEQRTKAIEGNLKIESDKMGTVLTVHFPVLKKEIVV